MRQNASELVRRAEAGETVTITVAGRPAAVLGPVGARYWISWAEIKDVFRSSTDPDWGADHDLLDVGVVDPWTRR